MRRTIVALLLVLAACATDGAPDAAPATTSTEPATASTGATTTTTTAPAASTTTVAVHPAVEPTGEVVHASLVAPDGRTRTYRLYRPTAVAPDAPLVVALHGGTGNGDQFARASGYEGLAEANGFVVVFPDGTPTAIGPRNLVWNAGGCCAAAVRDDVDDIGFLSALVEDLGFGRALVVGHSNGAMMAFRLACEAADHVEAIAVQAGTVFVDDCAPSQPVSVLAVHGAADENVPLDGGVGPESVVGVSFPPVRDGLATLAEAAGCAHAEGPTVAAGDRTGVTVEDSGPCPDGIDVQLAVVAGADHGWMSDASARTWTFLSAHR